MSEEKEKNKKPISYTTLFIGSQDSHHIHSFVPS